MKNLFINLALTLAVFVTGDIAFAGKEGHGGHGVELASNRSRIFAFDLYERNLHASSQGAYSDPRALWIEGYLALHLAGIEDAPIELLARKFRDLFRIHHSSASALLAGVAYINWFHSPTDVQAVVIDEPLINLQVVQNNRDRILQVALRRGTQVLINLNYWRRMDPVNKAALIFHELVFAFTRPVTEQKYYQTNSLVVNCTIINSAGSVCSPRIYHGSSGAEYVTPGAPARHFVGMVFSPALFAKRDAYIQLIKSKLDLGTSAIFAQVIDQASIELFQPARARIDFLYNYTVPGDSKPTKVGYNIEWNTHEPMVVDRVREDLEFTCQKPDSNISGFSMELSVQYRRSTVVTNNEVNGRSSLYVDSIWSNVYEEVLSKTTVDFSEPCRSKVSDVLQWRDTVLNAWRTRRDSSPIILN